VTWVQTIRRETDNLRIDVADRGGKPLAQVIISIETADQDANPGTMVFDNILKNWSETEPGGATKIFTTKSGTYLLDRTSTTLMSGTRRVGIVNNFSPDTVTPGAHDHGLSDESGGAFNWSR
jgi:hypothetical protein